jgi:UrcA family protein
VHDVKIITADHTIRNLAISLTAMALLLLALTIPAVADVNEVRGMGLFLAEPQPVADNGPEAVYGKLKARSRELCGSDDLRIAGGIKRSQDVKDCYEGTLTAAVQRLDNDAVRQLHYR